MALFERSTRPEVVLTVYDRSTISIEQRQRAKPAGAIRVSSF